MCAFSCEHTTHACDLDDVCSSSMHAQLKPKLSKYNEQIDAIFVVTIMLSNR